MEILTDCDRICSDCENMDCVENTTPFNMRDITIESSEILEHDTLYTIRVPDGRDYKFLEAIRGLNL
jgi:hypothetical protein